MAYRLRYLPDCSMDRRQKMRTTMTKGNDRPFASLAKLAVLLLVTGAIGQPISAQTPGLTNLTLTSSSGTNSIDDAILCTYTLSGSATTAGVAWYRNGQPMMTLYMPFEGGVSNSLQDFSGRGMSPSAVGTTVWSATAGRCSRAWASRMRQRCRLRPKP